MTEPEQTTEQLTVVFADIVGSTPIFASAGPLEAGKGINLNMDRARELCDAHDGSMLKFTGDGFVTTFRDASSAVLFAVALRDSLAEQPIKVGDYILETRTGIHTAQLHRIETEYGNDIFGVGVNVAARIESAARPNEILLSPSTYKLLNEKDSKLGRRGIIEVVAEATE